MAGGEFCLCRFKGNDQVSDMVVTLQTECEQLFCQRQFMFPDLHQQMFKGVAESLYLIGGDNTCRALDGVNCPEEAVEVVSQRWNCFKGQKCRFHFSQHLDRFEGKGLPYLG